MAVHVPFGFFDESTHKGHIRTSRITVTTTQGKILDHNPDRLGVVIRNNGSADVYVGAITSDLTNDGHILGTKESLSLSTSVGLSAVASTATQVISIVEEMVR